MFSLNQGIKFVKEYDTRITVDKDIRFEGPKRLGYFWFSCNDEDESVCNQDKSSLRYLEIPDPVSINCLRGYDPKIKYGHNQSKSTNLLRWILENETILSNFPYDFICSSGILKDIMMSSSHSFDWSLSAIKIRGKIILSKNESIERQVRIDVQSEWDNKSTYTAKNLQSLITKNNDNCIPRKEDNSLFGVFHSKIGSHRILYAGYLDCLESKQELDKSFDDMKFVLIKKFNAPKQSQSSLQTNTWWSLATFSGVDTIVRVKCEKDFTVKNIDKLQADRLIGKQIRLKFVSELSLILDHFKSTITEENKCYTFHCNCRDKKVIGYMKMDGHQDLVPSWYVDGQLPNKTQ